MAKTAYVATVQLVICDDTVVSESHACDWVSGLLSEHAQQHGLLDWQYLSIGGQILSPSETGVNEDYEEGEFWYGKASND